MQVQLKKPELERFIDEQVKAGHFPTPEAVVEDALTRMRDEEHALTDEDLAALDAAEDQIERGEYRDWADVSAELRKKYLGE